LLYVTQFEELWFDALQSLIDLRQADFNHVVFMHVIKRDHVAMYRGKGYIKSEETKLREMANIHFIEWAENLFEQGMEVGAYIVVGSPVSQIVKAAEEEHIDLIVMEYQKKGVLQEFYEGSEIMEILRRTFTPVFVYKYIQPSGKVNEHPFEKPLIAVDWSPASNRAIEYMLGLKKVLKKVTVVHVASEKELQTSSAMEIQSLRKENRRKLDEVCDKFHKENIEAYNHFYVGDISKHIEKASQEWEASMIVAGTTGKEHVKEMFLGSVAKKLTKESALPVLLIPPKH